MRRPVVIIIILCVLVGGAVAAGLIYQRWHDSPRYALQQMVLALKARDMETFFKYLDLKELFNNTLKSSTKGMNREDQGGDDWTRFSRQLERKFARQIMPKLFDTFEKQIRKAIESYLRDLTTTQILALAAAVTTAHIEVEGDEARVTIHDPKTGNNMRLQMRRSPEEGSWRIVAVNYEDLKRFMKQEFTGAKPER